jgi:magnesium-transporting ATPase (P-type)
MLWINMVMDTLAGLAFAFEPPLKRYMQEKPKKKNEPILNKFMYIEILTLGLFSSLLCILFLKTPLISNIYSSKKALMAAFFGLFIFIDIFNSFNARTSRMNIFSNILRNKVFLFIMFFIVTIQLILIYYGGSMFRTTTLNIKELLTMITMASLVIPVSVFLKKYLKYKNLPNDV